MGCCGQREPEPAIEVEYTSPTGQKTVTQSETEAKILVSVNGGGNYVVKKKK